MKGMTIHVGGTTCIDVDVANDAVSMSAAASGAANDVASITADANAVVNDVVNENAGAEHTGAPE
jgi:hypothetical protein